MNEVIKTIFKRRAVRKYKEKAVNKEIIGQLIAAGRMAPSAMNRQPWKFYVVTSKDDISLFSKEIAKVGLKTIPKIGIKEAIKTVITGITHLSHGIDFLTSKDPVFHGAPLVIFITASKENEWAAIDIGMCSQNIMLAAKSLGLETCPIGFGKFIAKTKSYSKLNITLTDKVQLAISIGYGDEKPEVYQRNEDNVFYI